VIVGDANRCEVAMFLKVGTTAIVLKMIEDGFLPDFSLVNPVHAIHEVSRDLDLAMEIELIDGRRMSALQLQLEYLELARKYVDREDDTPDNREVIARWESVLEGLGADPMRLAGQLDWVAKLRVLDGYRQRDTLGWGDPKLRAVDLQYHDVRRDKGLYDRLVASGKVDRLTSDAEVERAIMEPPEDTRAFFRGRCISRYPDAIAAASWDSVILDAERESLQRVPMREPLKGTRAHVEELLDASPTAADLIDRLQG
jgi:proteasome accessory factor A